MGAATDPAAGVPEPAGDGDPAAEGPYAVCVGEALVDLLEGEADGQVVYRPAWGGSPLNVAVGLARLGDRVELVGSFGDDVLADRLHGFLAHAGVGLAGSVRARVPTSLALTTFDGAEPSFTFYGSPHSFGLLGPDQLDRDLIRRARAVHFGSVALLEPPVLAAVREVCALPGPLRTLDPNVRPALLARHPGGTGGYRALMDELYPRVDLVKLSADDAAALYGGTPEDAARRVRAAGAPAVVVTLGPRGALLLADGGLEHRVARPVHATDTTGAGDAVMAALLHGLLTTTPATTRDWLPLLDFALDAAACTVTAPGGATAMPTLEEVRARARPG